MEEIPVAQILHPLGNVHHELHQCLHGNVLGTKQEERLLLLFFFTRKSASYLHLGENSIFSLKCVAMRHGNKLQFFITNSTKKVLKEE